MQLRFPDAKSAHLTEAIAAGLGFATHAALRSRMGNGSLPVMELPPFNVVDFLERLTALGYDPRSSFLRPVAADLVQPVPSFVDLQASLRVWAATLKSVKSDQIDWGRYLHQQCASVFADTHDLGAPEQSSMGNAAHRWYAGADHSACLPGWGAMVDSHFFRFHPGCSDLYFFRPLPLANGGFVEYTSAVIAMPSKASNTTDGLDSAETMAGIFGWTCTSLPGWSWDSSSDSTLLLYRPSISHSERLRHWEGSFQRWLLENQRQLLKGAGASRRKVIEELISSPHVPVHVRSFEDFLSSYLREDQPPTRSKRPESFDGISQRLFEMWLAAMSR
ncbi:hypothetical protein [Comamonas endophytica]|uniref:FRG domain-containing protein n=1 Tax=Comamonas endophytica TaxID=2949090 RepID=A0ABY6G875_9BURK|nr:hypothetical protein [Acidovorax sp. 5MLIR]UYG51254.1 hypothetical protein M9799_14460 [Acidovorax sp. 5MLIR]